MTRLLSGIRLPRPNVLLGLCCLLLIVMLTACQSTSAQAWSDGQKVVAAAWSYVDKAYVDPSFNHQNWWGLRQRLLARDLSTPEATHAAIEEMLASLGDPFTRFLDRNRYDSLQTSTAGELSGVGLQIAINDDGQVIIMTPMVGSPAEAAGILSGDQIIGVAGKPVQGWSLDDVAEALRGLPDTQIAITLARQDEVVDVTLTRATIEINPVQASIIETQAGSPVAYIRLGQFNGHSAADMRAALTAAQQERVSAYILDLRNNPGGLLQAAIEIAGLWIPEGDIVQVMGRNGIVDSISASHQDLVQDPLVVLINGGSASASEVLAGALQDSGRAQLVGSRSFGKGLIQSLFDLPDGSGIAVTTAKYLTPSGHDINHEGIDPDITVLWSPVAREPDPQLAAALIALDHSANQQSEGVATIRSAAL
ncbi:MAG: S41 family peptidase [Cyanophyceae cyanobacterium]